MQASHALALAMLTIASVALLAAMGLEARPPTAAGAPSAGITISELPTPLNLPVVDTEGF